MAALCAINMFLRKPYKTTDDFYKAVNELVALLRIHGHEAEATKLHAILSGAWTTGSELIGELMLCLGDMQISPPKDVQKLKDDCHYFAKHHRKILGLD